MKRNTILLIFFILLIVGVIVGKVGLEYLSKTNDSTKETATIVPEKKSDIPNILPQNASNTEEFLEAVSKKAEENQKNYDTSLTTLAHKRWEDVFLEVNSVSQDYIKEHISTIEQNIEKTEDGSTIFKIKYRLKIGWVEAIGEDNFFLLVSSVKAKETGIKTKENAFFSREEVVNNVKNGIFSKISRISQKDTLDFSSRKEAEDAIASLLNATSQDVDILVGLEKTIQNKQELSDHLYIHGKTKNVASGSCEEAFISLLDKNVQFKRKCDK